MQVKVEQNQGNHASRNDDKSDVDDNNGNRDARGSNNGNSYARGRKKRRRPTIFKANVPFSYHAEHHQQGSSLGQVLSSQNVNDLISRLREKQLRKQEMVEDVGKGMRHVDLSRKYNILPTNFKRYYPKNIKSNSSEQMAASSSTEHPGHDSIPGQAPLPVRTRDLQMTSSRNTQRLKVCDCVQAKRPKFHNVPNLITSHPSFIMFQ